MMTVTEQSIETEPKAEPKFRLQLPWAAWRGMWFFPAAVLWMELVLRSFWDSTFPPIWGACS